MKYIILTKKQHIKYETRQGIHIIDLTDIDHQLSDAHEVSLRDGFSTCYVTYKHVKQLKQLVNYLSALRCDIEIV